MIDLSENLKIALYGGNPLYILMILEEQMREPGYNKEDLLEIVAKTIDYYENFDK